MFRFRIGGIAALLLFATLLGRVWAQCAPLPHAAADLDRLNAFWAIQVRLCKLPAGAANAYADRAQRIVWADQDWLDRMAQHYGSWAATGILAHEWGHMLQGDINGTAAELQADCYAGIYMRGIGLPWQDVAQFATANSLASDPKWRADGHGTAQERWSAARYGYMNYQGQDATALPAVCPLSPT